MTSHPLTIGIDARAATEVGAGRGRVVRELLRALAVQDDGSRYLCYCREPWGESLGERFEWRPLPARDPLWHARVGRAAGRECDVFLATNSYLSVLLTPIPTVAIVYDLVTFDQRLSPNRRSMIVERLTLGAAVRRARGLVCISQATAEDLCRRFPAARGRASVALLGSSPALDRAGTGSSETLPAPGFVLAVGTLEPRKNLPRLAEAYACLDLGMQREHPLVIVGARGWSTGPTMTALRSLGDRALVLGHVSDADLAELYRRCAVFCYPSLGEGFGLPVLEAMNAGAAVVTSGVSSLPEVGGDAVLYVEPTDVADIARGIERALGDPELRAGMVARGRAQATRFSWGSFAAVVRAALGAAAQPRSS